MGTQAISNDHSRNPLSTGKASKTAILLTLLFVLPLLGMIPTDSVEEPPRMTSGKSTDPDVAVTDINITTPSVIGPSGNPILAPDNHIIRVSVTNLGGSTAYGNLTLKIGAVTVDNRTVDLNPGQQEVHLLYWDATLVSSSGISMSAVWEADSPPGDSDSSNDQLSINNIEVTSFEAASDIADTLPSAGTSLARALWQGNITVVNTGNQQVDVTAQLSLTPVLGGPAISLSSTTETLIPGSLANPPTPQDVAISFDGSNLEGNYTLGGTLLVTGASSNTVDIPSRIVNFIALRASLIPANSRSVDPGSLTILNFILQNSGASDEFSVTQQNDSEVDDWWADVPSQIYCSTCPNGLLEVNEGKTEAIQVPVNVPSDAENGETLTVTISVQSEAAGYVLSASTMVMAGGTYQAEITQNHSYVQPSSNPEVYLENFANITPGSPRTLDYTLRNTGTAPAQFQINVGATEAVPFWTIHSPISITDVVMPNTTRTIPVTISTPKVEMPLNPSWKVSSIETVDLIVQAIPLEGGVPATNQTTLVIDSIVELDVKITSGANTVSVDDILSDNTDRFVDFEVRIVHNLGTNSTLAQVSLSPTEEGQGSGKSFVGDTYASDASQSEHTRWNVSLSHETMELEPGEVGYGKIGMRFNSNFAFPYPAAGKFTYAFTASSDWASFPNTIARNSSASLSLSIDELWSAELSSPEVAVGDPSSPISTKMNVNNTGNDVANYTLGFVEIPGWSISLSSKAVNLLKSRVSLYPQTVDINPTGNSFEITVTATPPSTASADKVHEVWVYVNSSETGELLAYSPVLIQLTELISAELIPANSTAVIASEDIGSSGVAQTTIMLQLNNTGNSNRTFELSISNPSDAEIQVSFADDGTEQLNISQIVPPGGQAIVRVYATVGSTARADIDSKFEIFVSSFDEICACEIELDSSGITVQVAPRHATVILGPQMLMAAPGTTITVPLTLQNMGNLMEVLNVTAEFEGLHNWTYTTNLSEFSIEPHDDPNYEQQVELQITLPDLREDNITLEAGKIHTITIRAINITDPLPTWPSTKLVDGVEVSVPMSERMGVTAGMLKLDVEILPVFKLKEISTPDRISIVPGHDRTVEFEIENDGNAPMDVEIDWRTTDSEVDGIDRFEVLSNLPSTRMTLGCKGCDGEGIYPTGVSMSFSFSAVANDHFDGETGSFLLTFTPLSSPDSPDVEVDLPPRTIDATIFVVRVQTDDVIELSADNTGPDDDPFRYRCTNNTNENCRQIDIPWINLARLGSPNFAEITYTLGLDGDQGRLTTQPDLPKRLVNSNFWPNTEWAMLIDDGMCGIVDTSGAGPSVTSATQENCATQWDLDSSTPYDGGDLTGHGGTIRIEVFLPEKDSLAPGDGWNIYLQLRNPDEAATAAFWTDFVLKLRMTESSDPTITGISFSSEGIEGETTGINVRVENHGNAIMPTGVTVSLNCDSSPYADIQQAYSSQEVGPLTWNGSFTATWIVNLNPIPWYSSSEDLECTASLDYSNSEVPSGNNPENDIHSDSLEIDSWSTPSVDFAGIPLPSSFAAFLVIFFFALSLLRQGTDDDQNRLHASAYVAAMAFGTLSISGVSTLLTIASALGTIAFAGLVAWFSSGELQAIHDDRKKSKIGTRAQLEDHDKEQANTRKELRAIISCAPFAFIPFVLITPSLSIDMGANSLVTLVGFMVASPVLVHLILRFLDSSYDTLYSQLAEIELRAIRLKKILGGAGQRGSGGN
tara:strand:- start:681 stop:5891 length:5211 start_codon:yes stop_codon:yes gene_type:complete